MTIPSYASRTIRWHFGNRTLPLRLDISAQFQPLGPAEADQAGKAAMARNADIVGPARCLDAVTQFGGNGRAGVELRERATAD